VFHGAGGFPFLALNPFHLTGQDERRYRFSFDPDEAEVLSARPTLIVTGRHDASVGCRDGWRIVE
jgi:hypothetical protein